MASLGGIGTASGTCIGISGINIGGPEGQCQSTFGNFALVLGDGQAIANGTFLNAAIAIGNVIAMAGNPDGFSLGNIALNAGSAQDVPSQNVVAAGIIPESDEEEVPGSTAGSFNLAANLGGAGGTTGTGEPGTPMFIAATGIGSPAINVIGNRNRLISDGILANTTNVGSIFGFPANGSDNVLTSSGPVSVAFNYQGIFTEDCDTPTCGNTVNAEGLSSFAAAIGVVNQEVEQIGFGVNINNFSLGGGTSALAASNPNRFAPTTFANGSSNGSGGGQLSRSLTESSKQFSSSLKKLSAGIQKALGGLGKKKQSSEPKPETDS